MNISDLLKNPSKAKILLNEALIEKNKELAEALIPIVRHPYLTYNYAKVMVRGKIKDEWEDIIAQDPYASYYYARDVLRGPFIKGEDTIAQNPFTAYDYAYYVLKRPFPKGEDAIATLPSYSYYYAQDVLHDRFRKGEKTIINSREQIVEGEEDDYLTLYMHFLDSINKLDDFLKDYPEMKFW